LKKTPEAKTSSLPSGLGQWKKSRKRLLGRIKKSMKMKMKMKSRIKVRVPRSWPSIERKDPTASRNLTKARRVRSWNWE
jgi:hypothetical protein